MLDVCHTAFASKIFEKSLLIQYRVRFALLLIILGQPFIEGCNSIKIPDFRHFLTSFPSFIRIRVQWTACNIYPKTSFPFGENKMQLGIPCNLLLIKCIKHKKVLSRTNRKRPNTVRNKIEQQKSTAESRYTRGYNNPFVYPVSYGAW